MKLSALVSVVTFFVPQALAGCYSMNNKVTFTNYWVAKEGTVDMDNNGNILHLTGPKTKDLNGASGLIAKVSANTWNKCHMEGTCLLESGKLVNLDSGSTFEVVDRHQHPYGLGAYPDGSGLADPGKTTSLVPYVSIAVNDKSGGTKMLIKELKGLKLPNGKTHNGCVRVDDQSWSFGDCHIDWYVLSYDSYVKMNTPDNVHAEVSNCQILNYITASILDWALLTPGSLHQIPPPTSSGKKTGKKGKKGKTTKPTPTPKASKGPSCKTNDDCAGVTCCAINGHFCTNDNSAGTICM